MARVPVEKAQQGLLRGLDVLSLLYGYESGCFSGHSELTKGF